MHIMREKDDLRGGGLSTEEKAATRKMRQGRGGRISAKPQQSGGEMMVQWCSRSVKNRDATRGEGQHGHGGACCMEGDGME